jgi:hypothetical protein|tara:strand:- start:515 stop:994 length:480 start_codon:yes stop_codon:yes gene_type:complete
MTPEEYSNKRADEMLFPKRLQEANEMAMKRGKNLGYQVRPKLFPGEIEYFKKNPNTPGYADFESDSIVLNPFSTLPAEQLTFLVDNESLRLKMNKDKFVPPDFKITQEQKEFFEKTPYKDNPVAMRQTILARSYSGDNESMKYTPEQKQALKEYLSKDK